MVCENCFSTERKLSHHSCSWVKDHCLDNQDNRRAVLGVQTPGHCIATEVRCSCLDAAGSPASAPPGAGVWMDMARSRGEAGGPEVAPAPGASPSRPEAAAGAGDPTSLAGAEGNRRCCSRPCIAARRAASRRGLGGRSRRAGTPAAPSGLRSAEGNRGSLRAEDLPARPVHPGPSCCTSCEVGAPSAEARRGQAARPAVPPPPLEGEARCPGPPCPGAAALLGRWAEAGRDRWAAAGASMSSWLLLGCSLPLLTLRPSVTWTAPTTSIRSGRGSAGWAAARPTGARRTRAALGCPAGRVRDHQMVSAAENGGEGTFHLTVISNSIE